jgi:hypothetical protein
MDNLRKLCDERLLDELKEAVWRSSHYRRTRIIGNSFQLAREQDERVEALRNEILRRLRQNQQPGSS